MAIGDLLGQVSDIAYKWSTPFVKDLRESEASTAQREREMLEERLRINQLNGSGPVDAKAASDAPQGLLDFISGAGKSVLPQTGMQFGMLAVAGLLILGLIFLMRR